MTDESAFLRAIHVNPGDESLRLVYADWLEEHGDLLRAEYLRLQTQRPENCERLFDIRNQMFDARPANHGSLVLGWLTAVGKGQSFGDRSRFAAEVGEFYSANGQLRRVDLWAAGRWLTCDDHCVYVPQFLGSVANTIRWLRSGRDLSMPFPGLPPEETFRRLYEADDDARGRFWVLLHNWGPTTDNVLPLLFRQGDHLTIAFKFWREAHHDPEERGVIFVTELPESELLSVLEQLRDALQDDQLDPPDGL